MIKKEHYRDFIGTLSVKLEELDKEIKAVENDWVDETDWFEFNELSKEHYHYETIKKFFNENTERWAEFVNLDGLKKYVRVINASYKAMDLYSKTVLPNDGDDTIGISSEEWDEIETTRNNLREKTIAWATFVEFCENGTL